MFKVVPFLAGHVYQIDPHPVYIPYKPLMEKQAFSIEENQASHAVTFLVDGKPEACIGLVSYGMGMLTPGPSFLKRRLQDPSC